MSDTPTTPHPEFLLKHYKGVVFENVPIELDGHAFEDCTFVNCQIRYKGGPYRILGSFRRENVTWTFEQAAIRTLRLIRLLQSDRATVQQLFPGLLPPH